MCFIKHLGMTTADLGSCTSTSTTHYICRVGGDMVVSCRHRHVALYIVSILYYYWIQTSMPASSRNQEQWNLYKTGASFVISFYRHLQCNVSTKIDMTFYCNFFLSFNFHSINFICIKYPRFISYHITGSYRNSLSWNIVTFSHLRWNMDIILIFYYKNTLYCNTLPSGNANV